MCSPRILVLTGHTTILINRQIQKGWAPRWLRAGTSNSTTLRWWSMEAHPSIVDMLSLVLHSYPESPWAGPCLQTYGKARPLALTSNVGASHLRQIENGEGESARLACWNLMFRLPGRNYRH